MIVRAKLWRVVRVVWERGASACFGAASSGASKYADKLLGDLGMDVRKSLPGLWASFSQFPLCVCASSVGFCGFGRATPKIR